MPSPTLTQNVQTEDLAGSSSGATVSAPSITLVAGRSVIISVFWKTNVTITSISGITGAADVGAGRLSRPTDGFLQKFLASSVSGGATTVVANFSGTATEMSIYVEEWDGLATSSVVDGNSTGTASSGTSVTSGAVNTTNANDLLHGFCVTDDTNGSPGSGYTTIVATATSGAVTEYQNVSTTGSYTAAANMSATITKGAIILTAFKAAAASVTAALSGTALASITEVDVVTGGTTIIITLTGDTWILP